MDERMVLVPATRLVDLLDLVDRALPTVLDDRLRDALSGAAAELRVRSVLEPA